MPEHFYHLIQFNLMYQECEYYYYALIALCNYAQLQCGRLQLQILCIYTLFRCSTNYFTRLLDTMQQFNRPIADDDVHCSPFAGWPSLNK